MIIGPGQSTGKRGSLAGATLCLCPAVAGDITQGEMEPGRLRAGARLRLVRWRLAEMFGSRDIGCPAEGGRPGDGGRLSSASAG